MRIEKSKGVSIATTDCCIERLFKRPHQPALDGRSAEAWLRRTASSPCEATGDCCSCAHIFPTVSPAGRQRSLVHSVYEEGSFSTSGTAGPGCFRACRPEATWYYSNSRRDGWRTVYSVDGAHRRMPRRRVLLALQNLHPRQLGQGLHRDTLDPK